MGAGHYPSPGGGGGGRRILVLQYDKWLPVTSPPGRLATSELATKERSHIVLVIQFSSKYKASASRAVVVARSLSR